MAETKKKTATKKTEEKVKKEENGTNPVKEDRKIAEKTFSEAEVKKMIAEAVAEAVKNTPSAPATVIQMNPEEKVTLLYIGAISNGTTVLFGKLGQFSKAGNTIDVPKRDFLNSLGVPVVDDLLTHKNVIVIDGLNEEERERYGFQYKESELLTQTRYLKLFDYTEDEICGIFEKLCDSHKRLVAKMYLTQYFDKRDNRINQQTVQRLNKISKEVEPGGLFTPILEDIAEQIKK